MKKVAEMKTVARGQHFRVEFAKNNCYYETALIGGKKGVWSVRRQITAEDAKKFIKDA